MLNLLLLSTTHILFILHKNLFAWPQHPTNLLLELTSYLVCSTCLFHIKIFVINRVELVPINVVIDKLVLY